MNYCEKCGLVFDRPICPRCGRARLREPRGEDFCFLEEKEAIFAQMLMEMLKDNGIECAHKPVMGAALAMRTAPGMERHRIFVPYDRLTEAKELLEAYFKA